MTNLPDPPPGAEALAAALYAGARDHIAYAAVTLLCDVPGEIHAQPWFATYLDVRHVAGKHAAPGSEVPADELVAEVAWHRLGLDLLAGHGPDLDRPQRALLLIAASIGGPPKVHLGALLSELEPRHINLVNGALLAAAARAE